MKRSKKVIGTLFVSALVIGSSLTAFAMSVIPGTPPGGRCVTQITNNDCTAVGITDCSATPYKEFVGITNKITATGVDFTVEKTASSGVPTCQVVAQTADRRGFMSATTTHEIIYLPTGAHDHVKYKDISNAP